MEPELISLQMKEQGKTDPESFIEPLKFPLPIDNETIPSINNGKPSTDERKTSDEKDDKILSHVKECAIRLQDSTAPQTANDRRILRLMWIIAYLALFCVFMLQFSLLVRNYLKYEVNIQIAIHTAQSLKFPAVTVCNENPVRKSLIERISVFDDLMLLDAYAMGYIQTMAANENEDLNYTACAADWVVCNNTNVCIPDQWICNDVDNCGDNSDEEMPFNCTEIAEKRDNNQTENQGICNWPYIQCPGEDFCAEPCDGYAECTRQPNYDESTAAGCPKTLCQANLSATPTEQEFTSANFPNYYSNNLDCEWIISAPEDQKIELTFKEVFVEGEPGACIDFITIYNGGARNASVLKISDYRRFCGYSPPSSPTVISEGSEVMIVFKTDFTVVEEGFRIGYKSISSSAAERRQKRDAFLYSAGEKAEGLVVKNMRKRKSTTRHRRQASTPSGESGSSEVTNYDYDYEYAPYISGSEYESFYDNFNPTDQFFNVSSNDYFSMYKKSNLPDYSDFRLATTFTESEIEYNGYKANDFIVQCTFDNKKCDSTWFKTFQDPYYGNCFSFNSILDRNLSEKLFIRSSSKTGQEYGLKLTFFLDIAEYIGILGQNTGARAMINDPEVRPHVRAQSFAVGAGLNTFVSIRMNQISRKGGKYGNCTKTWPDWLNFNSEFKEKWPKYDRETCLFYCLQNEMALQCSCTDSYETDFSDNDDINNSSLSYCDPVDQTQSRCRQMVYNNYRNNQLSCSKCPQGCETILFSQRESNSPWPTTAFAPFFASKMIKSRSSRVQDFIGRVINQPNISHKHLAENFRQNFARLEVFYETMNFEKMSESPAYQMVNLISDFGGNIGLWLGWSVLAVFEVVQFIYEVGEIIFLKKCKNE